MDEIIAENVRAKEQHRMKEELARLNRNKMLDYGQTVLEEHHPKISLEKQMEVNAKKETFHNLRTKFERQELKNFHQIKTAKVEEISKSLDSKSMSKNLKLIT